MCRKLLARLSAVHTVSMGHPTDNIIDALPLQVSLSALPGVDWARYSSSAPSAATGGWDLLTGDGLPFPAQQNGGGGLPAAPPLSLLNNGGRSGGRRYLPAASAEALSRHALLPAPEQRRPPQALQLAPRPLYPNFDATPARPIDYGFTRGTAAAGEAPSAPPLDHQLEVRSVAPP